MKPPGPPRLRGFSRWAAREQQVGDWLPYARMLDHNTIEARNGALLQVVQLRSFAFETADADDINHRQDLREAMLRALANSRLVLHHHIIRRQIDPPQNGEFTDPICGELERRWNNRLSGQPLFVNDQFLTLERRPAKGKAGLADTLMGAIGRGLGDKSGDLLRDRAELDAARDALLSALAAHAPRLLGRYDLDAGVCAEPLEFLSAILNGEMRPVMEPAGDIGRYLPYRRVSFGLDALELSGPSARSYGAILSLKEYPAQTSPSLLDGLLRLPFEMVVSESFAFVERQSALERIGLAVRRMRAADEDAASLRQGLIDAKDDVTVGRSVMGEHSFSLLMRAGGLEPLRLAVAEAGSALADAGAIAVREDVNLEPAFWAQFPGNSHLAARKSFISSANFAGFASLHGFATGQAEGGPWGGPLAVLETTGGTPYFVNFHNGDLGNFTVIGPSGSGKTVVMNFLAAQAQRLNPRIILFDKDRGSEIFVRAIGGRYSTLRVGEDSGFNPLQVDDTPGARAFLRTWIAQLVTAPGEQIANEDEALIAQAVDANFQQDPAYRRLRYLRELMGGSGRPSQTDLYSRLATWCDGGERAWVFDNPMDSLDNQARVLGFDITEVLDDQAVRTPVMMYAFHRIEERLDGSPVMIMIDEGWKALDDEVFAARIRDWMKTLRKRGAIIGFGTQNARDALDSRIAGAVVEQAATQIFMPNPKAQTADYCTGFGLSIQELEIVRSVPAQSRCFLIKQGAESALVRLDLSDAPEMLTLLSGRESTVRRLDEIRRRRGDLPEAWWTELTGAPYPGAAHTAVVSS